MNLQKIVCALDLSEHSKTVAEYACSLAKATGASIIAVYAAPTLTQYTGFHVPPNTIDSFVGEIVTGAEKADIIAKAIEGPVTSMISGSAIQFHPDCVVILDEEAAAKLEGKEDYAFAVKNSPKYKDFL